MIDISPFQCLPLLQLHYLDILFFFFRMQLMREMAPIACSKSALNMPLPLRYLIPHFLIFRFGFFGIFFVICIKIPHVIDL